MATLQQIKELNEFIQKIDAKIALAIKTQNALKEFSELKYPKYSIEYLGLELESLIKTKSSLERKKSQTIDSMIYIGLFTNRELEEISTTIDNLKNPVEKSIMAEASKLLEASRYLDDGLQNISSLPSGASKKLQQLNQKIKSNQQKLQEWKYLDPSNTIDALKEIYSSNQALLSQYQREKFAIERHRSEIRYQELEKQERIKYKKSIQSQIETFRQDILQAQQIRKLNTLSERNDVKLKSTISEINSQVQEFENEFTLSVNALEKLIEGSSLEKSKIEQQLKSMEPSILKFINAKNNIYRLRANEISKAQKKIKTYIFDMQQFPNKHQPLPSSINVGAKLHLSKLEKFGKKLSDMSREKDNYNMKELFLISSSLEALSQDQEEMLLSVDKYKQEKASDLELILKELTEKHQSMQNAIDKLVSENRVFAKDIPADIMYGLARLKLELPKLSKEIEQMKQNPQDTTMSWLETTYITGALQQKTKTLESYVGTYVFEHQYTSTDSLAVQIEYAKQQSYNEDIYFDVQDEIQYEDSFDLEKQSESQYDDSFELEKQNAMRGDDLKTIVEQKVDLNEIYRRNDKINNGILKNIINAIETQNSVDDATKKFKDPRRQKSKERILHNVKYIANHKGYEPDYKIKIILGLLEKNNKSVLIKKQPKIKAMAY